MFSSRGNDRRKSELARTEARKQRRLRPTLMALEDRRLLSTFTVTNTLDNGSVGTLRAGLSGRPTR